MKKMKISLIWLIVGMLSILCALIVNNSISVCFWIITESLNHYWVVIGSILMIGILLMKLLIKSCEI